MSQARTSAYYRRYAQELRAVAEMRRTHEGLLSTLELAKTYDKMADQMAEAEKSMADELVATSRKIPENPNSRESA